MEYQRTTDSTRSIPEEFSVTKDWYNERVKSFLLLKTGNRTRFVNWYKDLSSDDQAIARDMAFELALLASKKTES